MKRKPIPQFDLPVGGEVFNLASKAGCDGARLQREAQAAAELTRQAEAIERRCQPELITEQPEMI